jgi:hypothetical protein
MEYAMKVNKVVAEIVDLAIKSKKHRQARELTFLAVNVTPRNAPGACLEGLDTLVVDPETWEDRTPREVAHMAWANRKPATPAQKALY